MLTAGFRWAPDTLPMNRMIAMTISAGATTAAVADHARERVAHHAATGGHQHEEERAEQLGEQAAPFLVRVVEVSDALDDPLLVASERTRAGSARVLAVPRSWLPHIGSGWGIWARTAERVALPGLCTQVGFGTILFPDSPGLSIVCELAKHRAVGVAYHHLTSPISPAKSRRAVPVPW